MTQDKLYSKDITRYIDGVIKAAESKAETLWLEMQEYVLTDELMRSQLLPRLFEELATVNFNKSIWISGHFGSGKSHLLKMLSLVLSNTELLGDDSANVFASKSNKDFEFESNVKRTAAIPTETILFNIQAKSDGITSSNADPVLAVFAKVFNEHLGYSPNPMIAAFERVLDQKGNYTQFKQQYETQFNETWEKGRKLLLLNPAKSAEIFASLEEITKEEAIIGVRDFIKNYTLDSETFATLIANYLKDTPQTERLIFCVDEVGQYIAEDISKMLSLQSIAEDISSKSNGKAFIIVTSQNDLTATVGDFRAKQKNDFSKITGRFAFKIALTSANADEVIQKRLLAKNEAGETLLGAVYDKECNNLKTILRFEGDTPFNIKYKNKEHFVNTYPFVSYQFDLLQSSIKELQKNNAFIGGHQSIGERSMLSICQQVARLYASADTDKFVSFGAMFEGLTDMFQSNVISDITQANKLLSNNQLAVEVLKALFLVKYEKRLKTTVDNIAVLLLPSLNLNLQTFKQEVQQALNLLENNTYIQRTAAGVYEYLTNQEKDIENEIKNMTIESGTIQKTMQEILFGDLYNLPRVQLENKRYLNYEYGKRCDGALIGKEKDVYLHLVTPLCADEIMRNNIKNYSISNSSDLIVLLREDGKLRDEIHLYEQTKKYIQTTHPQESEVLKIAIIADKRVKNDERKRVIIDTLKEELVAAQMYILGNELTHITETDIRKKLTQGLTELLQAIYTNLRMLKYEYTEHSVANMIRKQDDIGLKTELSESELEIFNRLQRNKSNHERSTINSLLPIYKGRPYGWYPNAILALIAALYKRNKIALKRDGNMLSDEEVIATLTNNRLYENTVLEIEDQIQPSQIGRLKSFYQVYFGKPCVKSEPREISLAFTEELNSYLHKIENYNLQRRDFKFLKSLEAPLMQIKQLARQAHPYFFTNLKDFEDDLLDSKEDLLDRVEAFMEGSQRKIYEQVTLCLTRNDANLSYLSATNITKLHQVHDALAPYQGNIMQEAKTTLETIEQELTALQAQERADACQKITACKEKLQQFSDFEKLTEAQRNELLEPFEQKRNEIATSRYIATIRQSASDVVENYYYASLNKMAVWLTPPAAPAITGTADAIPTKPRITYVKRDSVKVNFSKPSLETQADVEHYIESLKERYMELIAENKKISL